MWERERECELNERRRREGGGTHVDGGDHAAVGDVQAVWWEGGVSGAGQGTRWRGRKEERKDAHRLVHGECVAVKLSSPARASRARRKACACGGPPSTMQKISCVWGGWVSMCVGGCAGRIIGWKGKGYYRKGKEGDSRRQAACRRARR